jgi:hypothetical protein
MNEIAARYRERHRERLKLEAREYRRRCREMSRMEAADAGDGRH